MLDLAAVVAEIAEQSCSGGAIAEDSVFYHGLTGSSGWSSKVADPIGIGFAIPLTSLSHKATLWRWQTLTAMVNWS